MRVQPRDFVQTGEGLWFAVVADALEDGRVLATLRYVPHHHGYRKLGTVEADAWLAAQHPDYLYHSPSRDVRLHGVPVERVSRHLRPRERLQRLLLQGPQDDLEQKLLGLVELFAAAGLDPHAFGVTGSLLPALHNPHSDLDLVVYGRQAFQQARQIVQALDAAGRLDPLDDAFWEDAYRRRSPALRFEEYRRHERRKWNKGSFLGTKFDLSLAMEEYADALPTLRKLGPARVRATLLDDCRVFDCPAVYRLQHRIAEVHAHTQTYVGQVFAGETLEAAGVLEELTGGGLRLVVGTSREAPGEWIRCLSDAG